MTLYRVTLEKLAEGKYLVWSDNIERIVDHCTFTNITTVVQLGSDELLMKNASKRENEVRKKKKSRG